MKHVEELRRVCEPYKRDGVNIRILPGDANDRLLSQVKGYPWKVRGVAFLDPYGMELQWEHIESTSANQEA